MKTLLCPKCKTEELKYKEITEVETVYSIDDDSYIDSDNDETNDILTVVHSEVFCPKCSLVLIPELAFELNEFLEDYKIYEQTYECSLLLNYHLLDQLVLYEITSEDVILEMFLNEHNWKDKLSEEEINSLSIKVKRVLQPIDLM